jgi:hypothetical protein
MQSIVYISSYNRFITEEQTIAPHSDWSQSKLEILSKERDHLIATRMLIMLIETAAWNNEALNIHHVSVRYIEDNVNIVFTCYIGNNLGF